MSGRRSPPGALLQFGDEGIEFLIGVRSVAITVVARERGPMIVLTEPDFQRDALGESCTDSLAE
jgi:hypothetical protein